MTRLIPPQVLSVLLFASCGRIDFVPHGSDSGGDTGTQLLTYRDAVLEDAPLAYWRLDDANATARDEMGRLDGTLQDGFALLEGQTAGATYFERAAGGSNRITQRFASTIGVFAYLVCTYDGTSIQLYANTVQVGAEVASTQSMQPAITSPVVLGSYPPPVTTVWLHGTLDEVAIYDHVLAADRIALHHAIGTLGPQ